MNRNLSTTCSAWDACCTLVMGCIFVMVFSIQMLFSCSTRLSGSICHTLKLFSSQKLTNVFVLERYLISLIASLWTVNRQKT